MPFLAMRRKQKLKYTIAKSMPLALLRLFTSPFEPSKCVHTVMSFQDLARYRTRRRSASAFAVSVKFKFSRDILRSSICSWSRFISLLENGTTLLHRMSRESLFATVAEIRKFRNGLEVPRMDGYAICVHACHVMSCHAEPDRKSVV